MVHLGSRPRSTRWTADHVAGCLGGVLVRGRVWVRLRLRDRIRAGQALHESVP